MSKGKDIQNDNTNNEKKLFFKYLQKTCFEIFIVSIYTIPVQGYI